MASAWNLPPVPLTEELILKVGASFKAGQYRSPQNYFSRAIQEHRSMTKTNPSYFLQQLIKNTTRSIVRGMGPTPFKDSFEIELCWICPYNLPTGQATWLEDPAAKIDATFSGLLGRLGVYVILEVNDELKCRGREGSPKFVWWIGCRDHSLGMW